MIKKYLVYIFDIILFVLLFEIIREFAEVINGNEEPNDYILLFFVCISTINIALKNDERT